MIHFFIGPRNFRRTAAVVVAMFLFGFAVTTSPLARASSFCFPQMKDVEATAWYCEAIKHLAGENIIDSNKNFRPSDQLNRAEALKIMFEASGVPAEEITTQFFDLQATWFTKYFFTAYAYQYIKSESQHLNPGKPISKAEFIILFMKIFEVDPASSTCSLGATFSNANYTLAPWINVTSDEANRYLCQASVLGLAEKIHEQAVERAVAIQLLSNMLK